MVQTKNFLNTGNAISLVVAGILLLSLHVSQGFGQVSSPQGQGTDSDQKTIRFNFDREDWDFVIPWFAQQAGFSLQPIDQWPEGTFYLRDESEYTPMEALDQLNHSLRRLNPPFTLIRNRNMLILAPLDVADFPDDLIETVRADQLDQRGKYETIICIFEIGDELDIDLIYEDFRPFISDANRNFFAKSPAANQIRVRETGSQLRILRDILESAKRRAIIDNKRTVTYFLKHTDAETFMLMARGQLDMEPGSDTSRDRSITITREPFGKRMFVRATDRMHKVFEEVAAVIDVAPEDEGKVEVKRKYLQQYPIMGDPEFGYALVEMVLEGRGARMDQDKVTNAIMVLGTEDDHLLVNEALEALTQSGGQKFIIVPLAYGDATQILNALMNLMRMSAFDENPDRPVVFADTDKNALIVRGSPREVIEIEEMISQLDLNSKTEFSRSRSSTRVLAVDEQAADYLPDMLEFLLQAEGRPNPIEVVSPKDRGDFRSRIQQRNFERFNRRGSSENEAKDDVQGNQEDLSQATSNSRLGLNSFVYQLPLLGASLFSRGAMAPMLSVINDNSQDEDRDLIGRSSFEDDDPYGYRPADPVRSIPGAPIYVEFIEGRLILRSDDLDALDDLEAAIKRELGGSSEVAKPKLFEIEFRRVNELKDVLENFFGMSSGDSGGGGSPLGNIVGNMLPMGNLFGDLFSSPAGGGTSGSADLEGDVSFKIDLKNNFLFVHGATYNDLALIAFYIELLDVPSPPHEPDFVGETYTISVRHRNPQDLKETIEAAYPQYIEKPQAEGNQGANEAQAMMRMLQQIQGGGRGGAGSGQEQKPATVTLAVDAVGKRLIVTGPDYIYYKIKALVTALDQPTPSPRQELLYLERPLVDMEVLKQVLGNKYPGRLLFNDEDALSSQNQASAGDSQRGGEQRQSRPQAGPSPQDIQRAIMQRMGGAMGQQGGGQRGGGQRGGGQRGGGR